MTEGTHGLGGHPINGIDDVEKCQAVCEDIMNCRAIDFDKNANAVSCYYFTTMDYQTETAPGVTHYIMTRCGAAG